MNLHSVTASASVFAGLAGVFGVVPSSTGFTTALFQAYRVSTIKKVRAPPGSMAPWHVSGHELTLPLALSVPLQVAVLLRSDNEELKASPCGQKLQAHQPLWGLGTSVPPAQSALSGHARQAYPPVPNAL